MSQVSEHSHPPPRPPPPRNLRAVSFTTTTPSTSSQNLPLNSNSLENNLPSYNEIVSCNSLLHQRRNSFGDEQLPSNLQKMRRSKSFHKKSRRKTRPQITIFSSQPMINHPAFMDGNKGSCVPPEAPPSYDEAVKDSSATSSRDELISDFASPSETSLSSNVSSISQCNFDSSLSAIENSNFLLPVVPFASSSVVGRYNTNQNHIDTTETVISSTTLPLSTEANSSTSLSTTVTNSNSLQPQASTSQPRKKVLSNNSDTSSRVIVKPPVPRKPSLALCCSTNNLFSTTIPDNQPPNDMKTEKKILGSTSVEAKFSNVAEKESKVVSKPKKLPPPVPPPPKPLANSKKLSSLDVKHKHTWLNVDGDDPSYATINIEQKAIENIRSAKSDYPVEENTLQENSDLNLENCEEGTDKDVAASNSLEPTYAVVQKTSQKQSAKSITDLLTPVEESESASVFEEDFENVVPPPIPETRPPIEDYDDILNQVQEPSEFEAVQSIKDEYGADHHTNLENSSSTFGSDHNITEDDSVDHPYASVYHEIILDEKKQEIEEEDPYEVVVFPEEVVKPNTSRQNLRRTSRINLPPPPPPPATPTTLPRHGFRGKDLSNNSDCSVLTKKQPPCKSHSMRFNETPVKFLKSQISSTDSDNPKTVSENSKKLQRNETWSVTSSEKKVKRPAPPRPTLPLLLQNKFRDMEIPKRKPSATTPSSPVIEKTTNSIAKDEFPTRAKSPSSFDGGSPRKNLPLPKPPSTPTRPSTLSPDLPPASDSNLAGGAPHPGPLPKLRSRSNGSSSLLSPSKRAPPKPARPPPAPKQRASPKNNDLSVENPSFLDVIKSKNENEPIVKPAVDDELESYLSGEVHCFALCDYQPTNFTDLSFAAGEKILILREINEQLLFGRNAEGEEGSFPRTYVSVNLNSNNSNAKPIAKPRKSRKLSNATVLGIATALYDYTNDNSDDLNFLEGSQIDVIEFVGSEWLKGRIGNHVGIFPRNFVDFQFTDSKETPASKSKSTIFNASYDFSAMYDDELSCKVGDRIELVSVVDHHWIKGRCNGKTGLFPLSYVSEDSKNDVTSEQSAQEKSKSNLSRTVVALRSFNGKSNSELSFKKHDVIQITAQIDDRWLKGTLEGKTGILPADFVAAYRKHS